MHFCQRKSKTSPHPRPAVLFSPSNFPSLLASCLLAQQQKYCTQKYLNQFQHFIFKTSAALVVNNAHVGVTIPDVLSACIQLPSMLKSFSSGDIIWQSIEVRSPISSGNQMDNLTTKQINIKLNRKTGIKGMDRNNYD